MYTTIIGLSNVNQLLLPQTTYIWTGLEVFIVKNFYLVNMTSL